MAVTEVSSVFTVFPTEYHHTNNDKGASVETMSVVQVCLVSPTLQADLSDKKEVAEASSASTTLPADVPNNREVAEVSSASTTLPTEALH